MHPKTNFEPLSPKVVLGVAAHPDDLDFGASGTMASYAAQGARVYYLILTDGSKGTADLNTKSAKLIEMRRAEQQAAVDAIQGAGAEFLSYPDGMLEVTMDLKKDIVKVIRRLKPDVVITMDPSVLYSPERGFINHPDHRAAGQATIDAVFPLARDHLSFPELFAQGFEPHKTATLLLTNFDKSNFYVDISDTIEQKMSALAAHASQMTDLTGTQAMMRDFAAQSGAANGTSYAEGFMRIDVRG